MFYCAEINGSFNLRLPVYSDGKCHCYPDVPYSKLFGYIGEHIHETIRDIEGNFERHDTTSSELFQKYPIEFSFVYKNNSVFQNIELCVNDYQIANGSGHGPKIEKNHRSFDKQILIFFKFAEQMNDQFVEVFNDVWKNRSINLKGYFEIPKKNIVENINDFDFDFDDNNIYYIFEDFTIKEKNETLKQNVENEQTMMFFYNNRDKTNSIFIENITKTPLDDVMEKEELINRLKFKNTLEFILDKSEAIV